MNIKITPINLVIISFWLSVIFLYLVFACASGYSFHFFESASVLSDFAV